MYPCHADNFSLFSFIDLSSAFPMEHNSAVPFIDSDWTFLRSVSRFFIFVVALLNVRLTDDCCH